MGKPRFGYIAVSLLVLVGFNVSCSTRAAVPGVSLPEPIVGTFGAACTQLREFLVMNRGAVPPGENRTAAINVAAHLYEAFHEPLPVRTEAGLCRTGSDIFRFDDGGSMVRHILKVLARADLKPEVIGLSEDQLRQELLDDFLARIAHERVGAEYHGRGCSAHPQWSVLMSTIHEAVTRWQFKIAELDLIPAERVDLASRMGTPLPGSPLLVENCPA